MYKIMALSVMVLVFSLGFAATLVSAHTVQDNALYRIGDSPNIFPEPIDDPQCEREGIGGGTGHTIQDCVPPRGP